MLKPQQRIRFAKAACFIIPLNDNKLRLKNLTLDLKPKVCQPLYVTAVKCTSAKIILERFEFLHNYLDICSTSIY